MVKPQMINKAAGSHGKAPESSPRHASPSPGTGTTSAVTTIIGTANAAVTRMVRRGDEGISAARIAIINPMPPSCSIDTWPSAMFTACTLASA